MSLEDLFVVKTSTPLLRCRRLAEQNHVNAGASDALAEGADYGEELCRVPAPFCCISFGGDVRRDRLPLSR